MVKTAKQRAIDTFDYCLENNLDDVRQASDLVALICQADGLMDDLKKVNDPKTKYELYSTLKQYIEEISIELYNG